jgi:2'-hydroxyisoflavone reductase
MDVLVLGGTSFVGRWIAQDLLDRGHSPTLFTRGKTGADLFPGTPRAHGDRDTGDYASVAGTTWDAVVDVSAYVPRHVQQASAAVDTGRYVFISTVSVYDHTAAGDGITEDSPLLPEHRETEVVDGATYGGLKVACERDVTQLWGDRATIVRPGIVAGPHDPTDRFTYWTRAEGSVEVPGRLEQPVQVVDARDLARLVVLLAEKDQPGTYNGVGPHPAVTLGELVLACGASEVREGEVDPAYPLVLPDPSADPLFRASAARARDVGMPATPLAQTAADTRAWDLERGRPEIPLP